MRRARVGMMDSCVRSRCDFVRVVGVEGDSFVVGER